VNVLGVKATPAVSWICAVVYQPCGVDALHPELLNGTGFSVKVATSVEVFDGPVDGGCVGAVVLL